MPRCSDVRYHELVGIPRDPHSCQNLSKVFSSRFCRAGTEGLVVGLTVHRTLLTLDTRGPLHSNHRRRPSVWRCETLPTVDNRSFSVFSVCRGVSLVDPVLIRSANSSFRCPSTSFSLDPVHAPLMDSCFLNSRYSAQKDRVTHETDTV